MGNKTESHGKLKQRHVSMISIAGIIGAGLFVGSGSVINATGPAAVVSYAAAGLLVVLLMRMLGEMAMVNPDKGSFATYAQQGIGAWAGYAVGWLYWFFWLIVIAIEATAGGAIVHEWLPSVPIWLLSLILT
ncbi:amino acid permease, partial [Priestia megaterium]